MEFKDILVLVDDSPHSAVRIDVAISLAKRNGAHLTGLYVITHSHYTSQREGLEEKMAAARDVFSQKTAVGDVESEWCCVDWPVSGVSMAEIVIWHAYYKDLVIVGQVAQGAGDVPSELPERVVKGSGRPVLVVPYAGTFSAVGNNVMIAWNSGRESVRAFNDAMPLLQHAEQVNVLAVSTGDAQENSGRNICADIATHLSRHGIKANVDLLQTGDVPIGDVMLNAAWEKGCDLLVMGAYTYTARGTLALGPVARHILDHMPMPVLMSH
jgi:nucleotide-binding universal stress UspA family protein